LLAAVTSIVRGRQILLAGETGLRQPALPAAVTNG
jgi:hypothetical protein